MAVTKGQAEQVLANLKQYFAAHLDGVPEASHPILVQDWDWVAPPIAWAILWEEGPYDWAMYVGGGGFDWEIYHLAKDEVGEEAARRMATREPMTMPDGLWLEPVNGWSVGIYEV